MSIKVVPKQKQPKTLIKTPDEVLPPYFRDLGIKRSPLVDIHLGGRKPRTGFKAGIGIKSRADKPGRFTPFVGVSFKKKF